MDEQKEDWRRRCEWCGRLIGEHRQARRIYCSVECKRRGYDVLIARERAAARVNIRCSFCGKRVKAKRKDRLYCCLKCQWRARYWRDPEKKRMHNRVQYDRRKSAGRPEPAPPAHGPLDLWGG